MPFVFMVCEHEYMNTDLTTSLHLIVLKIIKPLCPLVYFNYCETRSRLHESGTKSKRHEHRKLHHVYMRPKQNHSRKISLRHNSFYSRYLHETATKIAQTGLKSSHLLDRVDYVQSGKKFRAGLSMVSSVQQAGSLQTGLSYFRPGLM